MIGSLTRPWRTLGTALALLLCVLAVTACGTDSTAPQANVPDRLTAHRVVTEQVGPDIWETTYASSVSSDTVQACSPFSGCRDLTFMEDYELGQTIDWLTNPSQSYQCRSAGDKLRQLRTANKVKVGSSAPATLYAGYSALLLTDGTVLWEYVILAPNVATGGIFENRVTLTHEGAHSAGVHSWDPDPLRRQWDNATLYDPAAEQIAQSCEQYGG
jgi:hypothetical protein